jgi:hypothetical protein
MDRQFFERNMLALSKTDPALCTRLSSAVTTKGIYRFIEARTGESIPALGNPAGAAHPLHSTVDPRKEGAKLVSTLSEEGFIIFLGLGGAFAAEAALQREATKKVLVIEYDCNGIAELLSSKDYITLLKDSRFRLLADPPGTFIEKQLLDSYIPAIDGGIRVFPLRTRTDGDDRFTEAGTAIKNAIDAVSRDYSVQAYFGKRWFSNIIRNLPLTEKQSGGIPPVRRAAICAAGPSLDDQIALIKRERKDFFLIATDTSLPALLHGGIEPDAVISIDCQHISYRHFFDSIPAGTKLFLDLSSPPPVASRTENRFFFSGGHPLGLYISRNWRALPLLDTSGANVSYAALSLAESLGAQEIKTYGADFSYPRGKTYARGTYIYPYFENLQSRYKPMEAQHSAFLYRDASLQKHFSESGPDNWRYDTQSLRFYRERASQKEFAIVSSRNSGTELLARGTGGTKQLSIFSAGPFHQSALDFLHSYKESIALLRSFDSLKNRENPGEAEILTTLLPLAASVRRTSPALNTDELFETVQSCALQALSKLHSYS